MTQSTLINSYARVIIAVMSVLALCAAMLLQISVPEWFVVFCSSIVVFYFGTHNGKSEAQMTQASEVATAALTKSVEQHV